MNQTAPTVRLHLWLENDRGVYFGMGRAMLLLKVQELGSLKKAADKLGISYRAAWGKIRKSEEVLGVRLIAPNSCRKKGCQLTEEGRQITEKFLLWFQEVEEEAVMKAGEIFGCRIDRYEA